jgi:hypothetical protein
MAAALKRLLATATPKAGASTKFTQASRSSMKAEACRMRQW